MCTHKLPLLTATLITAVLACSTVTANNKCQLTMGWSEFKPYEYLGANNLPTGIDLDIAKEVASDLDCNITFKFMAWKRLVRGIQYGTIDILASATKSSERNKWARFSDSYTQEKMVLFVRKGEAEQYPIRYLSDIAKLTIKIGMINGAYIGPEFEQLMTFNEFSNNIDKVNRSIQNVQKLFLHRIDGYIANLYTDRLFQLEQQVLSKIEVHPIPVYSTDLHFMLSKKTTSAKFLEQFNQRLNAMKKDGRYQKIIDLHTQYK